MELLEAGGNMIHKKTEVKNIVTSKRDLTLMVIKSRESKKVTGFLSFNFELKKSIKIFLVPYPFVGEANKNLKPGLKGIDRSFELRGESRLI
jgi:hypothetical protein